MPRDYIYRTNTRDVDFTRRASLTAMCDYIVQAASEDASATGAGIDFLYSKSLAWVLCRMSLELKRYPSQLENFTIRTWVESIDRLIVRRNMEIVDSNNEVIGSAITYWAIINFESRMSEDCRDFPHFFEKIEPIASTMSAPERVRPFDAEITSEQRVRYSHIDFNRHTNSTKYIAWMLNMLDVERLRKYDPFRLDVNFMNESRYLDLISITTKDESDISYFSAKNVETSKPVCTAKIVWHKK